MILDVIYAILTIYIYIGLVYIYIHRCRCMSYVTFLPIYYMFILFIYLCFSVCISFSMCIFTFTDDCNIERLNSQLKVQRKL